MLPNLQFSVDLFTFTEEIFNEKLHFLCSRCLWGPGYFSDGSFITVRWGHPHSAYAQGGRGGVKPIAYDCVQGGMGEECLRLRAYKIFFWTTKSEDFFFV